MDEVGVLCKVKIGADEEAGKIEGVAEKVDKAGKGGDAFLALPGVQVGVRATGIKDVPGKRGQFHGEHHLGSCHLEGLIAEVVECADGVTGTAMSVEEKKEGMDRLDNKVAEGQAGGASGAGLYGEKGRT